MFFKDTPGLKVGRIRVASRIYNILRRVGSVGMYPGLFELV